MANKHMKICSILLVISEMKIKAILRSTAYLLKVLRLTLSSVGEDVAKQAISYSNGGIAKLHSGKYLVVSYKHTPVI